MIPEFRMADWGGRFRETESLLCILSKICWANGISTFRLNHLARRCNANSRRIQHMLIDGLSGLDSFAAATGIAEKTLRGGTAQAVLGARLHAIKSGTAPHLRWCPQCLSEGFHSILFQIPVFARCGVHDDFLVERCPSCGDRIPYAIPSNRDYMFRCGCGHNLWVPIQKKWVDRPDDAIFTKMTEWASDLVDRCVEYSSGLESPTIQWMTEAGVSRWSDHGLPELDGVFSARELLDPCATFYWGGRAAIGDCIDDEAAYFEVAESISRFAGMDYRGLPAWVDAHSGAGPHRRADLPIFAFAAWRAFWEGSWSQSVGGSATSVGGAVGKTFTKHFESIPPPAGFSLRALVGARSIAIREMLRATFVQSFLQIGRPVLGFEEIGRAKASIPETPRVILLVNEFPSGPVVEWVHGKVLALAGRQVFGQNRGFGVERGISE